MKPILISNTKITPKVDFDNATGKLVIEGRSLPEQAYSLYKPIVEWIEEYVESPAPKTTLTINLEYFNSSSNKYILLILKKFDDGLFKQGKDIEVFWHYDEDDEDSYDTVMEYKEVLDLPINLVEVE